MESLECNNITEQSWYDNNILLKIDQNRIATLCLNRVNKHNALNDEMIQALNKAFDFLEEYHSENNSNIRLLILKSNGKTFCAGADLKSMQEMIDYSYDDNYQDAVSLARVLDRLSNFAFCIASGPLADNFLIVSCTKSLSIVLVVNILDNIFNSKAFLAVNLSAVKMNLMACLYPIVATR